MISISGLTLLRPFAVVLNTYEGLSRGRPGARAVCLCSRGAYYLPSVTYELSNQRRVSASSAKLNLRTTVLLCSICVRSGGGSVAQANQSLYVWPVMGIDIGGS